MPLFERNQVVLAKIETTKGTDATPTGTNAILCDVVNPTVDGQSLENNVVRSSISAMPQKFVNKTVRATIAVRVKGSGTAGTPPEFSPLLQCSGLKETATASTKVEYTPVNSASDQKTATLYIYKDGLLIKAVGGMANMSFSGRYGEYGSFTFEYEGIFAGALDASNPTPTYDSTEPIEMKSEGFAFGEWDDAVAREFGFETGNTIISRGNINSDTGLMPYLITARDPRWSANIESVLESENTFWGDYQDRDTVALSLTHGATAGNIVEFSAPKANFDAPTFNSENSLNMYDLGGQLLEDSGEDNFKITFK